MGVIETIAATCLYLVATFLWSQTYVRYGVFLINQRQTILSDYYRTVWDLGGIFFHAGILYLLLTGILTANGIIEYGYIRFGSLFFLGAGLLWLSVAFKHTHLTAKVLIPFFGLWLTTLTGLIAISFLEMKEIHLFVSFLSVLTAIPFWISAR